MEGNIVNIKLEKNFYGVKKALEILNEEFKEFALKDKNPKEFFNLYNKFFFELSRFNFEKCERMLDQNP